jgi:hypothetical protein
MLDKKQTLFDEFVISSLPDMKVDSTDSGAFVDQRAPIIDKSTQLSASYTSRVGRWGSCGSYYELGNSIIRLFSGVMEPQPDSFDWESYHEAAKWGLNEVKESEATAYMERIDFRADVVKHVVITGYYNVTTDLWGWATIVTQESGNCSAAFIARDDHRWDRRCGWETSSWLTGSDHKTITLQYGDQDGAGLAWFWRF